MDETAEEIKNRDLTPAAVARWSAPKKTWFFERGDGTIIFAEEAEAWDIVHNRSEWKRHDFKLIGVSDGTTYQKLAKESMAAAKRLEPEIAKKKAEVKRYEVAEGDLLVGEAVDMEDKADPINAANIAKVERLRKIIDRIHGEIDALEAQYKKATGDVVKRAQAAELEAARGHIEWPSAVNIATPGASQQERQKILTLMGGRV